MWRVQRNDWLVVIIVQREVGSVLSGGNLNRASRTVCHFGVLGEAFFAFETLLAERYSGPSSA